MLEELREGAICKFALVGGAWLGSFPDEGHLDWVLMAGKEFARQEGCGEETGHASLGFPVQWDFPSSWP